MSKLDLPDIMQLEDPFVPEQAQQEESNKQTPPPTEDKSASEPTKDLKQKDDQSHAPSSSDSTGHESQQSPKANVNELNVSEGEKGKEPQSTLAHPDKHVPKNSSLLGSTNDNHQQTQNEGVNRKLEGEFTRVAKVKPHECPLVQENSKIKNCTLLARWLKSPKLSNAPAVTTFTYHYVTEMWR
uniref:Uncharacterized protein n=1 Tax=Eutreptiella gymnastica TaxID=73025 RepID=A0A7S1I4W9_9EUGL|mmetsp:Transcript_13046/g.23480  ORF Transcript_13046/g.23480 Transcript_13046/m.23480 type:complete len:184 (+) Transcript_13046:579-1130(+)